MKKHEVREYCQAEFENIDSVLRELSPLIRKQKNHCTTAELASIATFIHNFYNGIENILKRVLLFKKASLKASSTWHKDLLKESLDQEVIGPSLYNSLSNYLSFRHFFVHSYVFTLKWKDLKPLLDDLRITLREFKASINNAV